MLKTFGTLLGPESPFGSAWKSTRTNFLVFLGRGWGKKVDYYSFLRCEGFMDE
jgi:hypothetical protein